MNQGHAEGDRPKDINCTGACPSLEQQGLQGFQESMLLFGVGRFYLRLVFVIYGKLAWSFLLTVETQFWCLLLTVENWLGLFASGSPRPEIGLGVLDEP